MDTNYVFQAVVFVSVDEDGAEVDEHHQLQRRLLGSDHPTLDETCPMQVFTPGLPNWRHPRLTLSPEGKRCGLLTQRGVATVRGMPKDPR